jgi:gluconate 5-dehydrogenase
MVKDLFDLSGKIVLVTGGTHGIGMAIAMSLAAANATICINGTNEGRLKKCKEEYKKEGVDAFTLKFDVTKEKEVDDGISVIEKEIGSIDILVNNAAIIKRIPILEMPVTDFKQVVEVDLIGPFIVTKRVVPGMIKKGYGKVINLCSMMSEYGRNTISAYASSKGGLNIIFRLMELVQVILLLNKQLHFVRGIIRLTI